MKNMFVIINGSGGNGKDTFVKDVTRVAPEHDLEVINFSTVDFYKAIIQCIGHYYKEVAEAAAKKDDKFRSCLARLKAQFDNDYEMDTYLLDHLINAIGSMNYKNPMDRLIFIHCREPKNIQLTKWRLNQEETKYLLSKYAEVLGVPGKNLNIDIGVRTLLVYGRHDPTEYTNMADRSVYNYNYDYRIDNSGSKKDLEFQARSWLGTLMQDLTQTSTS